MLGLVDRHDPRQAVGARPPELRPVLVVVVGEHADARVGLDVHKPLQPGRPFALVIDGAIERVAVERETDRHEMGGSVRPQRGEVRHARRCE